MYCPTCGEDPCGGCSRCTEADDLRRELQTAFWTAPDDMTLGEFRGKYQAEYTRLLKLEQQP